MWSGRYVASPVVGFRRDLLEDSADPARERLNVQRSQLAPLFAMVGVAGVPGR